MGSKSDTFETEMLDLIFTNTAIADIGNLGGLLPSSVEGNLYVSLHTGTLTDASAQSLTETAYTDYVRKVVPRNATYWTVAAGSCSPALDIDFVECGATPGAAVTHFAIGKEVAGGGEVILYWGALTPPITMATGVIPRIKTTSTITED